VDATPNECGRDVEVLREISERAGIQTICSTGYYFEGEGAPAYFAFRQGLGSAPAEVEELMLAEITDGIGDTGIKAGVVKLASSKDEITDYEKMFFTAGAKAQRCGCPNSGGAVIRQVYVPLALTSWSSASNFASYLYMVLEHCRCRDP
jgi:predicted metal-dependent phosphotriesterase family hydrolase